MTPPRRRGPEREGPAGTTPPDRPAVEDLRAELDAAEARRRPRPGKAGRGRVARPEPEGWDPGETWDERDAWEEFPPSKPIPVEGGIEARTRRGAIGSSWWSRRFLDAIEAVLVGGRPGRGRAYARRGQVIDLDVRPGRIEAQVQGSRETPYRIRLTLPVVPEEDWERILAALGAEAGFAAKMLAGDLPHEVEDVFIAEGASLFPGPHARLTTECTCPDWANPCKHIAAVCYLVAEGFDRDPFAVLAWRGRARAAIIEELRRRRTNHEPPGDAADPAAAGNAAAGNAAAGNAAAAPHHAPRAGSAPLAECIDTFWHAGPELELVRIRPEAPELATAVLRHLPRGLVEVRGKDVVEHLGPAYEEISAVAARRAVGGDAGEGRRRGRSVSGSLQR